MTRENRLALRRDPSGHFAKGVTGNPGGRPRGLASYIRQQTSDGQKLVDFVMKVFDGEEIDGQKPGTRMRMEAATWLSDRGFGKPVQGILHASVNSAIDDRMKAMSDEDLQAIIAAGKEALAPAA